MELQEANKVMEIVNESCQKIAKIKEKVDTKRMNDPKAHLIYEGLRFCYSEILEMQDKLEKYMLSEDEKEFVGDFYYAKEIKKLLNDYKKRLRLVGIKTKDFPQIIGVELAIFELNNIIGEKLR